MLLVFRYLLEMVGLQEALENSQPCEVFLISLLIIPQYIVKKKIKKGTKEKNRFDDALSLEMTLMT